MNGGRSDASTSTDDVKGRPLCLFYFTHPFGVLSPEPPTLAAAPPHVARAFLNMEPVSPFFWSSATGRAASSSDASYRSTAESGTLSYDIGDTTVHADPVRVVSVTRTRQCTVKLPARRDSLSSSLFSDAWFASSASRSPEYPRRALLCHRILPPLPHRLPSPPVADDVWPRKCLHPEKFSLPPIEMPAPAAAAELDAARSAGSGSACEVRAARRRRRGVRKIRRRRHGRGPDVRRMVTCLMRRTVRGGGECSPSPTPALQRVLRTIRDAWAEPRSLWERCRALSRTYERTCFDGLQRHRDRTYDRDRAMLPGAELCEPPRPDASPGLLRRRYSVPETIMRKYRLAQHRSDSEESGAVTHQSAASACPSPAREASCSPCDSPHRYMRRDRELMRKSALLRRLWARPCRCCAEETRETRSLDGSRSELRALSARRSPAPRALPCSSPKRQRLEGPDRRAAADLSYAETTTDVFSDSEASRLGCGASGASPPSSERLSEPATAEPETEDCSPPNSDALRDRSYADSNSFSSSVSTTKEPNDSDAQPPGRGPLSSNGHIEGRVSERSAGADNDDRNVLPYERPFAVAGTEPAPLPPYEMLEIVVSEVADATTPDGLGLGLGTGSSLTRDKTRYNMNIDEYVSNILVQSLNSLTDQLESMNASIGGDRKISIVEKEIKVKLQNTGVNTIVHLSPTSNHQIIFGNEELCNEPRDERDECNNALSVRDERAHSAESNNNLTSSAGPAAAAFVPPLQSDNVNRAVLHQIQKLFRDELRSLDAGEYATDAKPGVSHVEVSSVDAYMASRGEERARLEISTRADSDLIGGIGAGNYFRDGDDAAAVPRFSAFPHTESMEVNTSSSDDGEVLRSDCTSLVDSLDDPTSPRGALVRRRDLARSAVSVLELLPEGTRAADPRPEAFFIRIEDDDRARDEENVRVAEYMPEKIKQRLHRRHRNRELRMECARRSKVKQLKKELERRRGEEQARARRDLERDCLAIVGALVDDVIARVAQDEYRSMRIKHASGRLAAAKSDENLAKRNRLRDLEALDDRDICKNLKNSGARFPTVRENRTSERHQIRGKLVARPSVATSDRRPRRIYQKSEIHEGENCIEILEILEYVNGAPSSPETTNSDENHNLSSRCKKSRIPIPVYERTQTRKGDVQMRLTGGDGRRASPPPGRLLADMLLQALADEPRRAAPAPPEPRERSNSLRFKRVFEIIPEERSSLSFESSPEDAELARRASAPEAVPPPAPLPAPPRRGADARSAGTSPLAAAEEQRARCLRSQTTMTSPCSKSAATSPLRPAAAAREGCTERSRESLAGPADDRIARGRGAASPGGGAPPQHRERASPAPAPLASRTKPESRSRRVSVSGAHEASRSFGQGEASRAAQGRGRGEVSSSDSGDSGGSLLCSLAPRWLSAQTRQRRRARRPAHAAPPASPPPVLPPPPSIDRGPAGPGSGAWSVTVAGSCRAALPADVEMRLRFPHDAAASPPHPCSALPTTCQECRCVQCARCAGSGARAVLPPAPPSTAHDPRLTLTLKKEAQDSSILASKSLRKSSEQLPELETYRASRTKLKSSVKAVVSDAAGVLPALLAARRRARARKGQ